MSSLGIPLSTSWTTACCASREFSNSPTTVCAILPPLLLLRFIFVEVPGFPRRFRRPPAKYVDPPCARRLRLRDAVPRAGACAPPRCFWLYESPLLELAVFRRPVLPQGPE